MFKLEKFEEPLSSLQNSISNEIRYDKSELFYVYLFIVALIEQISFWSTGDLDKKFKDHAKRYFDSPHEPELKRQPTRLLLNILHFRILSNKQSAENLDNWYIQLVEFSELTYTYLTQRPIIDDRPKNGGSN